MTQKQQITYQQQRNEISKFFSQHNQSDCQQLTWKMFLYIFQNLSLCSLVIKLKIPFYILAKENEVLNQQ